MRCDPLRWMAGLFGWFLWRSSTDIFYGARPGIRDRTSSGSMKAHALFADEGCSLTAKRPHSDCTLIAMQLQFNRGGAPVDYSIGYYGTSVDVNWEDAIFAWRIRYATRILSRNLFLSAPVTVSIACSILSSSPDTVRAGPGLRQQRRETEFE